jgi:ABC-type lipoprotein release transport system permease subunit
VHIDPADIAGVAAGAALIVWLFSIFPSHQGATLSPVEGLRDG